MCLSLILYATNREPVGLTAGGAQLRLAGARVQVHFAASVLRVTPEVRGAANFVEAVAIPGASRQGGKTEDIGAVVD